jgi:DNA-binding transcriptional MerR regulator
MTRAAGIVTLRALGLSLSQVARVLADDPQGLEPALAAHQTTLEGRIISSVRLAHSALRERGFMSSNVIASVAKQSISPRKERMDCFAEPVIRRRFAPTGWLAMTAVQRIGV